MQEHVDSFHLKVLILLSKLNLIPPLICSWRQKPVFGRYPAFPCLQLEKHKRDKSTENKQKWIPTAWQWTPLTWHSRTLNLEISRVKKTKNCINLDAAQHWVMTRPLGHTALLGSSGQIWELRLDFVHGQNEWSHCHHTWKTLPGARKQSCG